MLLICGHSYAIIEDTVPAAAETLWGGGGGREERRKRMWMRKKKRGLGRLLESLGSVV